MSNAVVIPAFWSKTIYQDGNTARQLIQPLTSGVLAGEERAWQVKTDTEAIPLVIRSADPDADLALCVTRHVLASLPRDLTENELRWQGSPEAEPPDSVLESLAGEFTIHVEADGKPGLRVPQAGALHAVLAHWSTRDPAPATIVLPTGTGKTETMVAVFASERLDRLLVLVPTQPLRNQIAEAFETYGVLRPAEVLRDGAKYPVVGRIEHAFSGLRAMRSFVNRCNVLVATPPALQASDPAVVEALLSRCTHLFIDEAHHVAAATWKQVRDAFAEKPVVQFTATPYRQDGQRLGGKIAYSFPLGLAQEMGYFESIKYVSVVALNQPDRAVAEQAIGQLRVDLEAGLDHLIMARVNSITRASDIVQPIYADLAPDFNPVILHSQLGAAARREAMSALNDRTSRVIVCVDMLGEGYDFPELKIAALHDPHRSLGAALQLIGRFARKRSDLGAATAVVARPEPGYDSRLRALYAEGNDWNSVIEALTVGAVESEEAVDQFEAGFGAPHGDRISMQTLHPKMSTVVYRTDCADWEPDALQELFAEENLIVAPSVNPGERVVWLVVEEHAPVRWADLRSIEDVSYHLHVLHWDKQRSLLYINSSDLESLHEHLAEAVCGKSARRITGEVVYRVLGDIRRPVPTNVGVLNIRNRSRRFSMHVGSDVYEGFPIAEQQTRTNTNIFVLGYEEGERVTMGAARKGRIWSQRVAESIHEWVQWCRQLGPRLQNEDMSMDAVLRNFVRPKPLNARPLLVPLAIDWPWLPFDGMGEGMKLQLNGQERHIIDVELNLIEQADTGPIKYRVVASDTELEYEADVQDGQLVHRALTQDAVVVKERSDPEPLSQYLNQVGVTIWFENEVVVEGPELLLELERERLPIDTDKLVVLDWRGVDIRRESQGPQRDPATVQARSANWLLGLRDWDVVLDDDSTGEVADLVGLIALDDQIIAHLVHCKFSSEDQPGARVEDLYAVCGQAHRSAHHRDDPPAMIKNLVRRERNRQAEGRSGLIKGDAEHLLAFEEHVRLRRMSFHVTISQPGLSKRRVADRQLQLLACAEVYIHEVANGTFDVWCNA
jgi:superfamily II DNA or RNA helicase